MYKIQVGQITRFNLANKRTTERFQKAAKIKYIHSTPKETKKITTKEEKMRVCIERECAKAIISSGF